MRRAPQIIQCIIIVILQENVWKTTLSYPSEHYMLHQGVRDQARIKYFIYASYFIHYNSQYLHRLKD